MKAYIYSGGCVSNLLDGQLIVDYLKQNRYTIVDDPKAADLIVVNTCAFDKISEDSSIEQINELKKRNGSAEFIVAGCLPAINKARMQGVHDGAYVIPKDLKKLDELIEPSQISISRMKRPTAWERRNGWKLIGRASAISNDDFCYIEAARGCLGHCSYCSIRKAIGTIRSVPLEQLIVSVKEGLSKGIRFFRLGADDIGEYGKDIGTSLADLLAEILKIQGDYKLWVLSTNPKSFLESYRALLPSLKDRRIECLGIAFQSGSQRVLTRMNRSVDLAEVTACLLDLRRDAPHLRIRSHFMVGFPGESWLDFYRTIVLMVRTRTFDCLIFSFDPKPGTQAAAMNEQTSEATRTARRAILKSIAKIGYRLCFHAPSSEERYGWDLLRQ